MGLLISIFAFFIIGFMIIFPLRKLAQKIYDETGYNGLNWLSKFLMIVFGIGNILLAIIFYDSVEKKYYGFLAGAIGIYVLFIIILILVNRKAGLKNALLLSILQDIAGVIMIFLFILNHCIMEGAFGNILKRILSIDQSTNNWFIY